ncbi:MAG TPA: hypothetical protein P5110_04380 [Candidatus Omnitrophota bacterium]|nr:hypothetical protein [Candidatus Omnitrophota bacterium]HRZ14728.1 hypothetical protein [Candidatus Omnitrophota bacterium]
MFTQTRGVVVVLLAVVLLLGTCSNSMAFISNPNGCFRSPTNAEARAGRSSFVPVNCRTGNDLSKSTTFNAKSYLFNTMPARNVLSTVSFDAKKNLNSSFNWKECGVQYNLNIKGTPDVTTNSVSGLHFNQGIASLKVGDTFNLYQGKANGTDQSITRYGFTINEIKTSADCKTVDITMTYDAKTENLRPRVFQPAA